MQVELRDIHKTFGTVHANAGISLTIPSASHPGNPGRERRREKHADEDPLGLHLCPTTERSCSTGQPSSSIRRRMPSRRGIGMLHQDPLDFPPMKLVRQFHPGPRRGACSPTGGAPRGSFASWPPSSSFALDPDAYVDSLTVGERQQLEILRLLWLGARVLILDEPTTGISQPQKEKLFATLKTLAAQGMTVIFVSHKLEDVEYLCSAGGRAPPGRARGHGRARPTRRSTWSR